MPEQKRKGTVYLIPCTIADDTADDTLPAVIKTKIATLDYFFVENVRTARRFISSLKIDVKIDDLKFEILDKKSSPEQMSVLFKPVLSGKSVGILSEAGCPGIADPGAVAVNYAHRNDISVKPLVGPSSILLALMGSGFSGQSFVFHGYLPIDKSQRVQAIKKLEKQARQLDQTQIFMETPYRNNQLVKDLLKHCQSETKLCIAKDITGGDEMIRTLPIREWRKQLPELHKVPTVFLLY